MARVLAGPEWGRQVGPAQPARLQVHRARWAWQPVQAARAAWVVAAERAAALRVQLVQLAAAWRVLLVAAGPQPRRSRKSTV